MRKERERPREELVVELLAAQGVQQSGKERGEPFYCKFTPAEVASVADLVPSAVPLWVVLRALAGPQLELEGKRAPDFPTLAAFANVSLATVKRHVPMLERAGLLEVKRRKGKAPTYTLRPPSSAQFEPHSREATADETGSIRAAAGFRMNRQRAQIELPRAHSEPPVTHRERDSERAFQIAGDELRKTKLEQEDQEALRPLVQHVASGVALLQQADPDSLEAAGIDELAASARDVSDWKTLGEIVSEATARLPPRLLPGAATPPPGGHRISGPIPTGPRP